jgi:hypothetical protein
VTVERLEVAPKLTEIKEAINPAQQVFRRSVLIEVERVEKSVLIPALCTHHQEVLPNTAWANSISPSYGRSMTFSTK